MDDPFNAAALEYHRLPQPGRAEPGGDGEVFIVGDRSRPVVGRRMHARIVLDKLCGHLLDY